MLGHEVAHVMRGHYLAALKQGGFTQIAGGIVQAKAGNSVISSAVVNAVKNIYAKGLDKADEFDADPDDFLAMLDNKNYQSLLDTDKFSELFKNKAAQGFNEFGEIDYDAILTMRHDQNIISTVTLNLHQNGFSRRAWSELPEDTYKSNGRVRHERLDPHGGL